VVGTGVAAGAAARSAERAVVVVVVEIEVEMMNLQALMWYSDVGHHVHVHDMTHGLFLDHNLLLCSLEARHYSPSNLSVHIQAFHNSHIQGNHHIWQMVDNPVAEIELVTGILPAP
jgi:hypothetical protein